MGIILHICLIFGHHTIIFTISAHPGNISSYFWDSYFYLSYFWASYFIRSYFCTSYFLPVLLFVVIFMCILFLGSYIWVVLLLWSLMTSAYINMGWLHTRMFLISVTSLLLLLATRSKADIEVSLLHGKRLVKTSLKEQQATKAKPILIFDNCAA